MKSMILFVAPEIASRGWIFSREIYISNRILRLVYIVLVSLDLSDLLQQDEPDADMREEYIFELSGVSLGFLSAMYHAILTLFCARKQ